LDETGVSGEPSPEGLLAEGEAVVGELCEYRREFGHWPVSLTQLGPNQARGAWQYSFDPDHHSRPEWRLDHVDDSPRSSICFIFNLDRRWGEWQLRWDGFTKQPQSKVVFPDTKVGARRDVGAIIAKLQADRKADPTHDLLYTKVILHFRLEAGDIAAAITECGDALAEHPDDVWLTSFLTAALVRDGFAARSQLPLPVEKRASITGRFSDYIHAACICYELGLPLRAAKMLDEAFSMERLRSLSAEQPGVQGDCWCASVLAIRMRDYELLSRVAEAWNVLHKAKGYGDASFRAFRAFANLQSGHGAVAKTEMRELGRQILKQPIWARNTDKLAEAVEKGDTSFEFDPGPFPPLDTCVLSVK
jgi:hypothetical protein